MCLPLHTDGRDEQTKTVAFSDSQFVYTMLRYIKEECPYIEGNPTEPDASWRGKKVAFEPNFGRKVTAFLPAMRCAIPASEEMGRPLVELKKETLVDFYGEDVVRGALGAQALQSDTQKADRRRKKRKKQEARLDEGETLLDTLQRELDVSAARFRSLAKWLDELRQKKDAEPVTPGGRH